MNPTALRYKPDMIMVTPYTYAVTSNPYGASTSGAAGSEPAMGWTRSKAWNTGRISDLTFDLSIILAHELGHAYYFEAGSDRFGLTGANDRMAVRVENAQRRILDGPNALTRTRH